MTQKVIDIHSVEEFKALLKKHDKVFVDFYAEWCPPCKEFGTILTDYLSSSSTSAITFAKIDVDALFDLSAEYGIRSIPTLVLFEKGKATKTHTGVLEKKELEQFLK